MAVDLVTPILPDFMNLFQRAITVGLLLLLVLLPLAFADDAQVVPNAA